MSAPRVMDVPDTRLAVRLASSVTVTEPAVARHEPHAAIKRALNKVGFIFTSCSLKCSLNPIGADISHRH